MRGAFAVVVMTALAGCTSTVVETPPTPGDPHLPPYGVEVLVTDATTGRALPGATVVATPDTGPVPRATSSDDGIARLVLERRASVRLTVTAPGHTTVGTTTLLLDTGEAGAVTGCTLLACAVTTDIALGGDRSLVEVVVVPSVLTAEARGRVAAAVKTPDGTVTPPGAGRSVVPLELPAASTLAAFVAEHVADVDVVLTWTNALTGAGNLDAVLACNDGDVALGDGGTAPPVPASRGVNLQWTAPAPAPDRRVGLAAEFGDAGCRAFAAGAVVHDATSDLDHHVAATFITRPLTQIPRVVSSR